MNSDELQACGEQRCWVNTVCNDKFCCCANYEMPGGLLVTCLLIIYATLMKPIFC